MCIHMTAIWSDPNIHSACPDLVWPAVLVSVSQLHGHFDIRLPKGRLCSGAGAFSRHCMFVGCCVCVRWVMHTLDGVCSSGASEAICIGYIE